MKHTHSKVYTFTHTHFNVTVQRINLLLKGKKNHSLAEPLRFYFIASVHGNELIW